MRNGRIVITSLALLLCVVNQAPGAKQPDSERITRELMSLESRDLNYNDTLHSARQKHMVLKLADLLANAGLLSATGYIRDHAQKKYIFISQPPVDVRIPIRQSRKVRKMGQALSNTNDDDYRLAGSIMIGLADCLSAGDNPGSKRKVLLLEEFYLSPNPGDKAMEENEEQLRGIAEEVMGSLKGILNGFSKEAQDKALESLNLQSILGGIENVF